MGSPLPHREAINKELDGWIEGDVIARREVDDFGTLVAVTKGKAGYRVIRAFGLGDGAGVSVDVQTDNIDEVIVHLLFRYQI